GVSAGGGATTYGARQSLIFSGVAFVLGFSAVFVILFYVLLALEVNLLLQYRSVVNLVTGLLVIALGLQTMGVIRIGFLMRDVRAHVEPRGGVLGALVLGVAFGAGWSPCIGPTLGAILSVAAARGFGGLPLMLVYCVGLAIPFLLVAVLADRLHGVLRTVNRHLGVVNLLAGGLLLLFGVFLATGQITQLDRIAPGSPFDL